MIKKEWKRFSEEYLRVGDEKKAAVFAGYKPAYGGRLLKNKEVADYIKRCREESLSELCPSIAGEEAGEAQPPHKPQNIALAAQIPSDAASADAPSAEQREGARLKSVAEAAEVLMLLSEVMRGEQISEDERPGLKEMMRAAELLGKRYALFSESAEPPETELRVIIEYSDEAGVGDEKKRGEQA